MKLKMLAISLIMPLSSSLLEASGKVHSCLEAELDLAGLFAEREASSEPF